MSYRSESDISIPVNLIRQWCYCPRVVYYQEMLDIAVARPRWVGQGERFHQHERELWKRRNLSRFGLDQGTTHHQLTMRDEHSGLHGIVDMAIETDEAVYPIEFKLSASKKKRGDILQLVAYAMLLEKHFSKPAHTGFLAGDGKILYKIDINKDKQNAVLHIADKIRTVLTQGMKPDSSATIVQCCNCEYVNHCNDRF